MNLHIEHDFKNKVMTQSFLEVFEISSAVDVAQWRSRWTQELKSWHSPYKCLVDCSNLRITTEKPEVAAALSLMFKFLEGLFLRKVCGYNYTGLCANALPFQLVPTEAEAVKFLGIREHVRTLATDFRSSIVLENHFRQHVVELSFSVETVIDTSEKLSALRDKLSNNLMQWHSPWNLLVDCTNFDISDSLTKDFGTMLRYFKGLFLKQAVGYGAKKGGDLYPFKMYRARHKAVAQLENEGMISGEAANCSSKSIK
jgi:hypothetical protein